MRKYIIVAILAVLAWKWIETNPFSQFIPNGQVQVNYSQAELQYAQADLARLPGKILQTYNTGAAAEFIANVAINPQTNAEKFSSVLFVIGAVVVIAISALLGALFLIVLIKLTTSHTTHV